MFKSTIADTCTQCKRWSASCYYLLNKRSHHVVEVQLKHTHC